MPRRNTAPGFSLIECAVTIIISGALLAVLFAFMSESLKSWARIQDRAALIQDIRSFRRTLEFQFRSATADPISIAQTSMPADTLRFASYSNGSNLANQFTQNELALVNNEVIWTRWDARYDAGALVPLSPWGSGGRRSIAISHVDSLQFQQANPSSGTSAVTVNVVQKKKSGAAEIVNTNAFIVKARNRAR